MFEAKPSMYYNKVQMFYLVTDGQKGGIDGIPPPPEVENLAKYPLNFARMTPPPPPPRILTSRCEDFKGF